MVDPIAEGQNISNTRQNNCASLFFVNFYYFLLQRNYETLAGRKQATISLNYCIFNTPLFRNCLGFGSFYVSSLISRQIFEYPWAYQIFAINSIFIVKQFIFVCLVAFTFFPIKFLQIKWNEGCCVFWRANGCSSHSLLVKIKFLSLKQLFQLLTEQNIEKRKESRTKTCINMQ